ncbi:hypothetical protein I3842_11G095300 [Carya illinoinensis]|uniref:Uncharacterized protein n=1 Tax=Carya illinoinensis TaxID=32201 RepID=A0A922DNJ6_CARIL|nr:hypothetical protein I3842_11G095300 [Carya illinoinensis]
MHLIKNFKHSIACSWAILNGFGTRWVDHLGALASECNVFVTHYTCTECSECNVMSLSLKKSWCAENIVMSCGVGGNVLFLQMTTLNLFLRPPHSLFVSLSQPHHSEANWLRN